eukprot:4033170-Prymnesium_polylepis.1
MPLGASEPCSSLSFSVKKQFGAKAPAVPEGCMTGACMHPSGLRVSRLNDEADDWRVLAFVCGRE